jgi:hypothetical protein
MLTDFLCPNNKFIPDQQLTTLQVHNATSPVAAASKYKESNKLIAILILSQPMDDETLASPLNAITLRIRSLTSGRQARSERHNTAIRALDIAGNLEILMLANNEHLVDDQDLLFPRDFLHALCAFRKQSQATSLAQVLLSSDGCAGAGARFRLLRFKRGSTGC